MKPATHKMLAMKAAITQGLLNEENPLLVLVHQQGIFDTVNDLHSAFPAHFTHCFAVKANPYLNILKILEKAGMGAEVASAPELELSLKAGFKTDNMVFDAPVKTPQEIDRALNLGIAFNIDNFQELDRLIDWFKSNKSNANIGFRINPQIGAGSVARTSTATLTSKFGIGLKDAGNQNKIIQACKDHTWINSLHVHVGSIGCPLELMCDGVKAIVELAQNINQTIGAKQIKMLDIGGGLPVDFTQDANNPTFSEYAMALSNAVPEVINGDFKITTEYGRAIVAKNAITIGRIEYTKKMGDSQIALGHIGVQTLMRTVFEPEDCERRISAFDTKGNLKTGNEIEQDIAGPACFSGDLIAQKRLMPLLQQGDFIMVHDTGAYHFSNHYQYNALPQLPVYAYTIDEQNRVSFECLSAGQSVNDVIDGYS